MGACASFPKGMKGGAPAGPLPEPEKEEDIAAAATSDVAEEEKAAVREVAVEGEEEKAAEEDVTDKSQSLGSLLNEASEAQTAPMETVKAEAAVAVTYQDDGDKAPAAYIRPVACVAGEEKVAEDQ